MGFWPRELSGIICLLYFVPQVIKTFESALKIQSQVCQYSCDTSYLTNRMRVGCCPRN